MLATVLEIFQYLWCRKKPLSRVFGKVALEAVTCLIAVGTVLRGVSWQWFLRSG